MRSPGDRRRRLQDPEINLAIGQQLMLTLAEDDVIDGDLIRLLAGYGQGQGGLRKWVDGVRDEGDPLMFIEAIPNGNTRQFIEDALVYSWQYAARTAPSRVEPGRARRRPLPAAGARGRGCQGCQRRDLRPRAAAAR